MAGAVKVRTWWQDLALLLAALGLITACAPIRLVPAYDEQIDAGLTSLYADTGAFVDRMIADHGTPAGAYPQNAGFYDAAGGRSRR